MRPQIIYVLMIHIACTDVRSTDTSSFLLYQTSKHQAPACRLGTIILTILRIGGTSSFLSVFTIFPWSCSDLASQVFAIFVSDTGHQALITHFSKYNHAPSVYVYSSIPSLHVPRHLLRRMGRTW